MDIGLIFDWILMLFLFGSAVHKLLGKERKAVEALGVHHSIGYLIGALQLIAIYFIYIGQYLPVFALVCLPYLIVAGLSLRIKEYTHVVALLIISAIIFLRGMYLDGMI